MMPMISNDFDDHRTKGDERVATEYLLKENFDKHRETRVKLLNGKAMVE